MASTSDSVVYDLSLQSERLAEQFTSKQWLWITDSNNGSYNGQVNIESSSLANSGRWLNYSEGIITIPVVMTMQGSKDISGKASPFSMAAKCGWHHLIDSCEIQYGNVSVQQTTPFSNVLTTFKMLTRMSQDCLEKYGPLLNFFPDDFKGWSYTAIGATTLSIGSSNNTLVVTPDYTQNNTIASQANSGLLRRLYTTNIPLSGTQFNRLSETQVAAIRRPSYKPVSPYLYWNATAVIRLKDISDFCAKLPLVKGGFLKITLNTNTGRTIPTVSDDGKYIASVSTNVQGRTFPAMLMSLAASNPNKSSFDEVGAKGTITADISIAKSGLSGGGVFAGLDSSCRLYVPAYTMAPEYEKAYLDAKPITEIVYQDVYQYTIVNQSSQFQQLLTNGIIDPQYLVVAPFFTTATNVVPTLLSPFASEPATTSPVAISQFQVQLSGKNMFQQDVNYDWLEFQAELAPIAALNGGQEDGLTSGLISYDLWSSIYRYYVCDLSRGMESDRYIPKSVLVSGTVQGAACDLLCFIVFNRKIAFRTENSEIVSL